MKKTVKKVKVTEKTAKIEKVKVKKMIIPSDPVEIAGGISIRHDGAKFVQLPATIVPDAHQPTTSPAIPVVSKSKEAKMRIQKRKDLISLRDAASNTAINLINNQMPVPKAIRQIMKDTQKQIEATYVHKDGDPNTVLVEWVKNGKGQRVGVVVASSVNGGNIGSFAHREGRVLVTGSRCHMSKAIKLVLPGKEPQDLLLNKKPLVKELDKFDEKKALKIAMGRLSEWKRNLRQYGILCLCNQKVPIVAESLRKPMEAMRERARRYFQNRDSEGHIWYPSVSISDTAGYKTPY